MKKVLFFAAMALITLSACAHQKQTITFEQLPQTAQQFINTYFADKDISLITKENDNITIEYEVRLIDGAEIDFRKDGTLDNIDTKTYAIPTGIIPQAIADYASKNYPSAFIVEYNPESRKDEIELNNGLSLEFDKKGNFLRIDD